nr:uncharacterized protein LOC102148371 isoform X2 [Equus caballus]
MPPGYSERPRRELPRVLGQPLGHHSRHAFRFMAQLPEIAGIHFRLMEPERGRTGALLQKGRKRRRARGKHVGAAEARRARSEPEERRPGAKVNVPAMDSFWVSETE